MHKTMLHIPSPIAMSILLAVVLTFLCVMPATAQMTNHQWELGFAVGNANLGSSGEDFDLDFRGDLRAGFLFADNFQLELQVIQADAFLDAELRAAMLNATFNFRPDTAIVPYVMFGGGYSSFDDVSFLIFSSNEDEEAAAYQVGVGSRFFVGSEKRMAVRVELSSLWIDTDFFESDRHTSFTAGLSWMVGAR